MRNNTANTVVLIVNLLLGRNSGLQIIMEDKMHGARSSGPINKVVNRRTYVSTVNIFRKLTLETTSTK